MEGENDYRPELAAGEAQNSACPKSPVADILAGVKIFPKSRKGRARRFRRMVGWALLTLVGINISLAVMIDQFRPDIRDPEYQQVADALRARTTEDPDARLILFLGSSRVALGVDAKQITEPGRIVFNFGMPGAGPFMMDVYWDRLQASGVRPDVVFVEFMHPFYNDTSSRTLDHSYLDASRLSVQEARTLVGYGNRSTGALRRMAIARLFPAGRHGPDLCEAIGLGALNTGTAKDPLQGKLDLFGGRALDVPPEKRDDMRGLAHKQYDPFYPDFSLAHDPAERLKQLLRKVRQSGATVKILLTPEGSEFRVMMSPEMAKAINEFMAKLEAEFDVEILDARDWMPDSAFYDQHHLLPSGGKLFAEQLRPHLDPLRRKPCDKMPR
ncbi:DUF1574 family protein [Zavarzinella formosa]|uniref:DUF1574 family protein n=1 Tax=Zavarzinella formosa TaxID=360055 RepID=UPI00031FF470|nr:DUF1574 family protein [Zavarzinella formosa]